MLGNWQNWCRLCANIDSTGTNALHKIEAIKDQLEIVNKYFMITLLPLEDVKSSICEDCRSFLAKLEGFKDLCLKTNQMFSEIILQKNLSESDLQAIRLKYGLDNEMNKHKLQIEDDPLQEIDHSLNVKHEPDAEGASGPRKRTKEKTNLKTKRKKKEHICSICLKKFPVPCLLKEHIWAQHRKEDRPFECSECHKRFSSKNYLRNHMVIHLPDDQRRVHSCPLCDKKFSQKFNVQIHINAIHIRDRPFICEECGKPCGTKSALKQHMETHTEERNFQCSLCPKMFKSQHQVKKHEVWHKDTVYPCPHCDVKLGSKVTLKRHMLVHSDAKQFKCNFCGSEFKRSKTLKNHLILHTGERPYECSFCDKTFANGSNYRTHQKKSHPVELANLEASGQRPRMTKMPRLDQLQPK